MYVYKIYIKSHIDDIIDKFSFMPLIIDIFTYFISFLILIAQVSAQCRITG